MPQILPVILRTDRRQAIIRRTSLPASSAPRFMLPFIQSGGELPVSLLFLRFLVPLQNAFAWLDERSACLTLNFARR
jgi:hypothetical protein